MNEIAADLRKPFTWPGRELRAVVAAALLVVLADLFFWTHSANLSLFVFFLALIVAILVVRGARPLTAPLATGIGLALLGAAPLIEAGTALGFLSASFGVTVLALATGKRLPRHIVDLPAVLVRFGLLSPVRLAADALRFSTHFAEKRMGRTLLRAIVMWVMPGLLALVFVGLFVAANPVIEAVMRSIRLDSLEQFLDLGRMFWWGACAAFVWAFLRPRLLRRRRAAEVQGPHQPKAEGLLFGSGAIVRALLLFNALFAVQTGLDLTYLWGGVALPDGMTYADYAHRGAYPLVATALLAAAFVLAAMRPGGAAQQSPLIRNLVYLFIAQNVMLVVSSILRLELYVEVYSLTELRVAAGIWMGLVAVGLMLILCRIALGKSNRWLIGANLLALGTTLYVCAYLDFTAMIAGYNVEHNALTDPDAVPLDAYYLLNLGPTAIPALDRYLTIAEAKRADAADIRVARDEFAAGFLMRDPYWGAWGLRDWRLAQYLSGRVAENATADDNRPDRR